MNDRAQEIAKLPEELRELADAACNGTLTVSQRDRLEDMVRQNEAARLAYLAYLDIHAQLSWEGRSGTQDACGGAAELAAASAAGATTPSPASTRRERTRRQRRGVWWTGVTVAAAAMLALAAVGLWQLWPPGREAVPDYVAVWGGGVGVSWQDTRASITRPPSLGDELEAGLYDLSEGIARLDFLGGAEVTVEGPARIELIDGQTGRLVHGSLVVRMPSQQPAGFTIRTQRVNLVDRGTEFGVSVDSDDQTFVQVFEGHVDALVTNDEDGETPIARRIWPLTAMRFAPEPATPARKVPFEPMRFARSYSEAAPAALEVASAPAVSLEQDPNATSHVKALAAALETAPAAVLQLGTIFEPYTELNDLTQSELTALVPALLQMLDDARPLPIDTGVVDSPVRLRVADRADLVLQFIAGISPAGQDRKAAWQAWWATAQGKPRTAWFAERQGAFRQALDNWRAGASYEASLVAANAVEIAARTGDQTVLPVLIDTVSQELPEAHRTEISLAAVLAGIGQLGTARLVPEMIPLARRMNRDQLAAVPAGYSEPHARRSHALQAFAAEFDRLAGTTLAAEALTPVGPPAYEMWAVDEGMFDQWLAAAAERAGEPVYQSPSDRTDGDAGGEASSSS